MPPRSPPPRPISCDEALIVKRVIEVGAEPSIAQALLSGIDLLVVQPLQGSLDFGSDGRHSVIVAGALGRMDNGKPVEMVLWADGAVITHLQLNPHGALGRAGLPTLASIHAYPPDAYGNDEG